MDERGRTSGGGRFALVWRGGGNTRTIFKNRAQSTGTDPGHQSLPSRHRPRVRVHARRPGSSCSGRGCARRLARPRRLPQRLVGGGVPPPFRELVLAQPDLQMQCSQISYGRSMAVVRKYS